MQSIFFLKNVSRVFGTFWLPKVSQMDRKGLSKSFKDARKITTKSAATQILSFYPNYNLDNWKLVEFVLEQSGKTTMYEYDWEKK